MSHGRCNRSQMPRRRCGRSSRLPPLHPNETDALGIFQAGGVIRVDFRVLGPLQVWDGGTRLVLPGSRHQRVLAALLLTPGAVVTIGRLIEATWDGEPPATATKQVQNCVSALRDRLGDTDQRIIVTDGPGYRVAVGENDLDLLRFAAMVTRARQAAGRGASREAVTEMREALRL